MSTRNGYISLHVRLKNSEPIPSGPGLLPTLSPRIASIISSAEMGSFNERAVSICA